MSNGYSAANLTLSFCYADERAAETYATLDTAHLRRRLTTERRGAARGS